MEREILRKNKEPKALLGTDRIEAFSGGVIEIIVPILILEIRVPEIYAFTSASA